MYTVEDVLLRHATPADIPALVWHYNRIVESNNAIVDRYIDWAPLDQDRLRLPVADQRLLIVVPRPDTHAPAISASIIIDKAPDERFWHPGELPARAMGFSKFGVAAELLGQDFGRAVAMPLVVDYALMHGVEVLYCDALPHLDRYYDGSLGFQKVGTATFFSNLRHQDVLVHRHVRELSPMRLCKTQKSTSRSSELNDPSQRPG